MQRKERNRFAVYKKQKCGQNAKLAIIYVT